jgi:pyruvate dehydrogenase E2 component (dihydrolipoamide acetyltransferase)
MAIDIKLPALGDNIDSGDVLEVKVREGDVIKKDQGILELETDKATVEVPSTHAGKVVKVHVKDGETVKIGASLITVEETQGAASAPAASPPKASAAAAKTPKEEEKPSPKPAAKPAPDAPRASEPVAQKAAEPAPQTASATATQETTPAETDDEESNGAGSAAIPAGPSVRRFAREVGVDLARVTGSGPGGRITREDVLAVVRTVNEVARGKKDGAGETHAKPTAEHGQLDAWGPVRIEKMPKIRKTIAKKMAESWSTATRVTNFDDADITELERIRQSSKNDYAEDGIKLTTLPLVIKAVAMSLKKHPVINASIDLEKDQVSYKGYVSIGVAVDTDRGLVVPALRNADKLSIAEIARQLASIAERVRGGNYTVDDLRGSTFTISNLGAVGGTYSTPMINVPEVAILLLGRSRKMPVVVDDEVVARLMMPLSLSYDHRLVDGAAAARFLNDVIGLLETPSRLLLAP